MNRPHSGDWRREEAIRQWTHEAKAANWGLDGEPVPDYPAAAPATEPPPQRWHLKNQTRLAAVAPGHPTSFATQDEALAAVEAIRVSHGIDCGRPFSDRS